MTTLGRNVGDEFIREGIRSFLDEAIGAYDAYYVDKHNLASLHEPRLDEIGRLGDKFADADLVVQAGAPVYWSLPKSQSWSCEWAEALWFERIFRLGSSKIILNLGAGACQASEEDLDQLLGDARMVSFAQQAGQACAWTTVRDPLAHAFLSELGVGHELLPCPALHAARRFCPGTPPRPRDLVGVNLMKLAGHYRLKPQTDSAAWLDTIQDLLPRLRCRHRLVFIAHDTQEAEFQRKLAREGEMVFLAGDYRDYLSIYSRVKAVVANRVHGAVCAAGFGRPAVIVGNDSRIGIARPIGIPAKDSSRASAQWIVEQLDEQIEHAPAIEKRLVELRESSANHYIQRLRALLHKPWRAAA